MTGNESNETDQARTHRFPGAQSRPLPALCATNGPAHTPHEIGLGRATASPGLPTHAQSVGNGPTTREGRTGETALPPFPRLNS